jgi:hypothetical protein
VDATGFGFHTEHRLDKLLGKATYSLCAREDAPLGFREIRKQQAEPGLRKLKRRQWRIY